MKKWATLTCYGLLLTTMLFLGLPVFAQETEIIAVPSIPGHDYTQDSIAAAAQSPDVHLQEMNGPDSLMVMMPYGPCGTIQRKGNAILWAPHDAGLYGYTDGKFAIASAVIECELYYKQIKANRDIATATDQVPSTELNSQASALQPHALSHTFATGRKADVDQANYSDPVAPAQSPLKADGDVLLVILLFIVGLAIYFLPASVAYNKEHPAKAGIFTLNLFLGWSFIGWVVALVWALNGRKEVDPVYLYAPVQPVYPDVPQPGRTLGNISQHRGPWQQ